MDVLFITFRVSFDRKPENSTALEDSPQQKVGDNSDSTSSEYDENFLDGLFDMDGWSENEVGDKVLPSLANMGYPVEEAEIAIERCGPEASIAVLTDFISAAQVAWEDDVYLPEDDLKPKPNYNEKRKRKFDEMSKKKIVTDKETIRLPKPMIGFGVPSELPEIVH
ncbi:DNA (cytosine-5)-methyltransferase DRM2 [Forsythia ovata]|uniref:DNA (Cytosine-5)-methyltransferase DRM2 n=1 Tax=Forsythia ovata TaxID=205694 RepID=A0ABD1WS62_9LAMI